MERFSIVVSFCCTLAIFTVSEIACLPAATIEASKYDTFDLRDVENRTVLSKKTRVERSITIDADHATDAKQNGNKTEAGDTSCFDKMSNGSSVTDRSGCVKENTKHEGNTSRIESSYDQTGSSVDLSSHDILLDPIAIRAKRQAETNEADFSSNIALQNETSVSNDTETDDENINSSRWSSRTLENDLRVAEDRYPPYWYQQQSRYPSPYPSHQRQYWNQRYRNDRPEPYRNYPRYPVFPGK